MASIISAWQAEGIKKREVPLKRPMKRYFDWLIEHEKLVVGVVLILVVALIVQLKFCEPQVAFGQSQSLSRLENPSGSRINVAGVWEMSVQKKKGGIQTWTLKLRQNGEQLTGVINSEGGDLPVTGTIKGEAIHLSAKRFGVTVEFPAVLSGDAMTGEMRVLTISRQWTSKRRM
jgi:hypothetical protein